MARRFYRFSYFTPGQKDRNQGTHELRDGDAALQVTDVLYEFGYQYGGLLLNPQGHSTSPLHVDDSFLGSGDLLLVTTRPPMNDSEDRSRGGGLKRSYTSLEQKIFHYLERYFARCSRLEVNLTPAVASKLPKELARKQAIVFRQYGRAMCISHTGPKREERAGTTVLYMTFTEEAWPGGPGLLTLFGMGGPETLIWSHLLRTKFRHLVCCRSFVMVEMTEPDIAGSQVNLCFADSWETRILLEIPLDETALAASF